MKFWTGRGSIRIFVHTKADPSKGEVVKITADVRLAIDCTEHLLANPAISTLVLVKGDGDFVHLVNRVKARGGGWSS